MLYIGQPLHEPELSILIQSIERNNQCPEDYIKYIGEIAYWTGALRHGPANGEIIIKEQDESNQ